MILGLVEQSMARVKTISGSDPKVKVNQALMDEISHLESLIEKLGEFKL